MAAPAVSSNRTRRPPITRWQHPQCPLENPAAASHHLRNTAYFILLCATQSQLSPHASLLHPARQDISTSPCTCPTPVAQVTEVDLKPDWNSEDKTHSQLWRIQHSVAEITPHSTVLEQLDHTANPPWYQQVDPTRVSISVPVPNRP